MPTASDQQERARVAAAARYRADPSRWADRYRAGRAAILARQHANGMQCRECLTPRHIAPKDRPRLAALGGPLCQECRRRERAELAEKVAEFKATRIATLPSHPRPRWAGRGSGRSGTGNSRYRKNRIIVLGGSDICGICGHGGSMTVDHIVSHRNWPRGDAGKLEPGFNDVSNLQGYAKKVSYPFHTVRAT